MSSELRARVLLSVQRALLGEITAEMRAVEVECSPERVVLRVYTHGDAGEGAREDFDASVVTQVAADVSNRDGNAPRVEYEFVRYDEPTRLPVRGTLVFARAGARTGSGAPAG